MRLRTSSWYLRSASTLLSANSHQTTLFALLGWKSSPQLQSAASQDHVFILGRSSRLCGRNKAVHAAREEKSWRKSSVVLVQSYFDQTLKKLQQTQNRMTRDTHTRTRSSFKGCAVLLLWYVELRNSKNRLLLLVFIHFNLKDPMKQKLELSSWVTADKRWQDHRRHLLSRC